MVVPLNKLDFNVIARHYYPKLMTRAEIMCHGNYTTAEEAVQDTMLTAWNKRDQVRVGHFDAWINQILNNKIRDAFRPHRKANYDMASLPTNYDRISSEPPESEALDKILNAIDALPANYRDVCKLTMVDELEQQEIASKLNIPLGTVQSRQSRSKLMLQNKLKGFKNG